MVAPQVDPSAIAPPRVIPGRFANNCRQELTGPAVDEERPVGGDHGEDFELGVIVMLDTNPAGPSATTGLMGAHPTSPYGVPASRGAAEYGNQP